MKHVPLNDSYKWAHGEVFSWAVGNYDDTGCHIRISAVWPHISLPCGQLFWL